MDSRDIYKAEEDKDKEESIEQVLSKFLYILN